MSSVDVVILAAGNSSRFGSDKRLLTLQPLIEKIVTALAEVSFRLLLVVKETDTATLPLLSGDFLKLPQLLLLYNPEPEQGIGHSLALAAQQLQAPVTMVFLADMPFIQPQTIRVLLQQATPENIVAPVYGNGRGHPVCFGQHFYAGLKALQGDSGAKNLLQQYADKTLLIAVDDAGVVQDIDTPQDWQAAHDSGLV